MNFCIIFAQGLWQSLHCSNLSMCAAEASTSVIFLMVTGSCLLSWQLQLCDSIHYEKSLCSSYISNWKKILELVKYSSLIYFNW